MLLLDLNSGDGRSIYGQIADGVKFAVAGGGVRQSLEQKVGLSSADALFREQTESDHRSLGPAPHDCAFCAG